MEQKGIDVSKWQGKIDWSKVKKSGIGFAMIRASFGREDTDPYFERNVTEALKQGIPCGAYHYCYAMSVAEAKREAAHFLKTVQGKPLAYPLALDLEDPSLQPLGKKTLTAIAAAFLEELEKAGYYAILYANRYWLTTLLERETLSRYDVWLAEWNKAPSFDGAFGIWQYSAKGKVNGIVGRVDLDVAYKDYPAIIKKAGLNGFLKETPVLPPPFREGERVAVKESAKTYATGEKIPAWVKGRPDTILRLSGERALLKGIYSWVRISDLERV